MADDKIEKPPVESEKVKLEGKGTLDSFLSGEGKLPANIDAALKEEEVKANADAEEELKHLDKGEEIPEKKPGGKVKTEEKPKPEPKEKEELIPDEFRKKYPGKIPDTIKTWKAYTEWAPQAEANMKKALAEKDRLGSANTKTEERLAKMEEALKSLNDKKVEEGLMSEEDRQIENERMKYLMENDPLEYTKQLKESLRKEALTEEQKRVESATKDQRDKILKDAHDRQTTEIEALRKKYDEEEEGKFDRDILPALTKIAAEKPYLQSFEEAEIIYLHNLKVAEDKAKAEDDAKRAEKKEIGTDTSHKSPGSPEGADEKNVKAIEGAETLADLEKAAKAAGI